MGSPDHALIAVMGAGEREPGLPSSAETCSGFVERLAVWCGMQRAFGHV